MTQPSCPNCLVQLEGAYCHNCGQSTRSTDRFFLTLINEAFEDILTLNSRVWKTLGNLLFKPGYLSKEYFAGRRVRYIPPIRLYFTLSILFFVVMSVYAFFEPQNHLQTTSVEVSQDEPSTQEEFKPQEVPTPQDAPTSGSPPIELSDDDQFRVAWLSEEESSALQKKFKVQLEKAKQIYELNPDAASDYFRDVAPPIIFCLLPLFALLLKLAYLFKGMYYTQHLVLAVHSHCFVFLWLTLLTLFDWLALSVGVSTTWFEFCMSVWSAVYLWLSLKNVYQQGALMTTIKYVVLSISYLVLFVTAFVGALIFGIMTV